MEYDDEEYRKCFEDYEVSNKGNLRRLLKNDTYKYIKCSIVGKKNIKYKYFQLIRDDHRKNIYIHHLVAKAFIGERPQGLVIDHIDRDCFNNDASNLRYCSYKENAMNTKSYRHDVLEQDSIKRRQILARMRYQSKKVPTSN